MVGCQPVVFVQPGVDVHFLWRMYAGCQEQQQYCDEFSQFRLVLEQDKNTTASRFRNADFQNNIFMWCRLRNSRCSWLFSPAYVVAAQTRFPELCVLK